MTSSAARLVQTDSASTAQLRALGDTTELAKGYHLSRYISRLNYALGHRCDEITHPVWLAAKRSVAAYEALSLDVQRMVQRNSDVDFDEATGVLQAALPLLELARSNYSHLSTRAIDHLISYANAQQ